MRHFSLGALVVTASLLGALAIGATSASATVLCKKAPSNNYCGYENFYPKGTNIEAELVPGNKARFEGSGGALYGECSASSIDMTLEEVGGLEESAAAGITAHSFGECAAPIKATATGWADIRWTSGTHGGSFWQSTYFETNTPTAWGIPGQCFYQLGGLHQIVPGAAPEIVYYQAPAFKLAGSHWVCGKEILFNARYNVTTPTPLYIEKY